MLLSNMMIYSDYMTCYSWLNMETLGLGWKICEKLKGKLKQNGWELNPGMCPYGGVYGFICKHQNLMKLFLDETKYPELSNHINYKSIGLVMRELWIFEENPWILYSVWPVWVMKDITRLYNSKLSATNFVEI